MLKTHHTHNLPKKKRRIHMQWKSRFKALGATVQPFGKAVWHILDNANHHHIYLAASGIAFNVLVFMLPTLLVIVFIVGTFVEEQRILAALNELLHQILPVGSNFDSVIWGLEGEVREVISGYKRAGWIGIPALIWVSLTLFNSIRTALSAVFGMQEHGSFWKYLAKDTIMLIVLVVAIGVVNFFPEILSVVVKWLLDSFPDLDARVLAVVAPVLVAKILTFLFFIVLYRFAPNSPPAFGVVVQSAFICTMFWELARFVFSWYLSHLAAYNQMYGIYATVAAVAFWVYYSALVVLFSAEIASYLRQRKRIVKQGNYINRVNRSA